MPRSATELVARWEHGAGLISSAAGIVVFLVFLLFSVQLLFGLYSSSTITAVANDAAQRAASSGAPRLDQIEAEARANLGRVGADARFAWATEDTDGDGLDDTVILSISATPPRFVPPSIGDAVGFGEVRRTARARIEEFGT
ncbi:MAG: hypothetical protein ACOYXM_07650 [Actinomycetota bacterium]